MAVSGSLRRRENHLGTFGWNDAVGPAEECPDCAIGEALPTDLFCAEHDRFLPFVGWQSKMRMGVTAAIALLLYCMVWLASEIESWVPLFLSAGMVGLATCVYPLRTHRRTAWITSACWTASCTAVLIDHEAGATDRRGATFAILLVAFIVLALHSALLTHLGMEEAGSDFQSEFSADIVKMAGPPLSIFLAAFSFWISSDLVLGNRNPEMAAKGALIVAVGGLAIAALLVAAGAVAEGMARVDWSAAPAIPMPTPPRRRTWKGERRPIERPSGKGFAKLGELTGIFARRTFDTVRIAAMTTARVSVNTLLELWHQAKMIVIRGLNVLIKAVVGMAKTLFHVAARILTMSLAVMLNALGGLCRSLISLGLPIAGLFVAATLSGLMAGDDLRYLTSGDLAGLLWTFLEAGSALLLLTLTWILLADQRFEMSAWSAVRSAGIAGPYTLMFVAVGGWFLAALTFLGFAHLHPGWITLATTGLLIAAYAWSVHAKNNDERPGLSATAEAAGPQM